MKVVLNKKIIVIGIIILFTISLFGPTIFGYKKNTRINPFEIIVNQVEDVIEICYEIDDFVEVPVVIDGIVYSVICIGEESNLLLGGMPDVPSICRSIVIPDSARMKVDIVSLDFVEFKDVLIAPSKGNLLRSVNPDDVPYVFGNVYFEDAWFPGDIVCLREPYILRDFRGQVVDVFPVQYNPVRKTMRFYHNIKVCVYPDRLDTVNIISRDRLPYSVVSDFKFIYNNHFINFGKSDRYDPVSEQGNMLVIVYDDFWDLMEPFVEWKNAKGIPTEMVNVSDIGGASAIKRFISDYYDEYGLTFVLLVGDVAQVPTLYSGGHASDPSYSYVVGGDYYPDLFVGRFSAQNFDDLDTQVERSIEYERDPQVGVDWYHKGIGVASNEGPGDDGEYDDKHVDIIRDKLMAYTYSEVDQIYDPYASSSMVTNALNDGRSIVNYCGHGSSSGWSSSGFRISHINNLENNNMLPFVISVACNNGQFNSYSSCFCEAWLRATNNSEPTGAIVATGSSKSMSWSPPMDAQDEMNDLIVESYANNIKHTFGGIHYNGCMHMNNEYGSIGYSETNTWHFFGDPSLPIRTDTPVEMAVTRDDMIEEKATSFEVTVLGVKDALCALSRHGELIGYSYTDGYGNALIEFEEPIMGEEPLDLVITAYNKIPYITEIPVYCNNPPYIPIKPEGPTSGKTRQEILFNTSTEDPDGDQVFYKWRWGDGFYSEWLGPYDSGETASASHSWSEEGHYKIWVKAKDIEGSETNWSESLTIGITKSKNKVSQNPFFLKFFNGLLDYFPIFNKIFSSWSLFNKIANIK